MQAYGAGGYSKSSFNNIHWDEKSARKWACYATAGQLAAMIGYGAAFGVPAEGIPGYVYGTSGAKEGSVGAFKLLEGLPLSRAVLYISIVGTANSAIKGDWESVGYDIIGYGAKLPISLAADYVKGTVRTCEGKL
ncbi:hypothetical protein [Leptospira alexanderi]|nr:hypothetical protein [Leptospira alexanderi]